MNTKATTAAVLLLISAVSLFARDVEILVKDTDLDLPLEGALLRSWNGTELICDENGKAVISVPDDRQVVIQAAYPGYENSRLLIPLGQDRFTLSLRLSGVMEGKELVLEAAQPGSNESKTGRSVAVSGRDIAQTAEIGLVEDVMTSIKLLPGVGYAGFFNALPSIRGGDPGDMTAALDGFYIFNPYFWGGGFSIFDPGMVESAQLSHGVFSSRYGHTVSGLLDISSKKPSPTETEFELGVSTSAANASLSLPLMGKGGILLMGRVTYYDPLMWLAKKVVNGMNIDSLDMVNSIRVAPYIRSTIITGNYRFFDNLELHATGFFGIDGIGYTFTNSNDTAELRSDSMEKFDWINYHGFFTAGLDWNPRNDMLLKLTAGTGYEDAVPDADLSFQIHEKSFSPYFTGHYGFMRDLTNDFEPYEYNSQMHYNETPRLFNAQGRIDYDWELGNNIILAAGVQELLNMLRYTSTQHGLIDMSFGDLDEQAQQSIADSLPGFPPDMLDYLRVQLPLDFSIDVENSMYTTSGYTLAEYTTPNQRFGAELGLRVDHYHLSGRDFSLSSKPAFNPRLNVDFNVFKDKGFIQSFDLTAGTGLFSSLVSNTIFLLEEKYNTDLTPTRSWTSVVGSRLDFSETFHFNIEAYYKYMYDRLYVPLNLGFDEVDVQPKTNGEGRAWGIDLMLQKKQSRLWDGWISYSFNWTKYRDPDSGAGNMDGIGGETLGDIWYFPAYHRFHNLNLVSNFRPAPKFNIYTRFGVASGVQLMRRIGDAPISYPVYVYENGGYFIEEYYWPEERDEKNRTTPSFPLDVKFSIFGSSKSGRTNYELYVAIENILVLLYTAQGNKQFDIYTGEVASGRNSASIEMPIPIPSFGFRVSY